MSPLEQAPSQPTPTDRAWRWPLFLVGLLVLCVVTQGVLVVAAVSDPRQHVEADYYAKGLAWDAQRAAQRASARLGWTLELELQRVDAGARILQLTVRDATGQPLTGASARCRARHRAALDRELSAELTETAPGVYQGAFAMTREGHWELDLELVRGEDRYVASEVLDSRGVPQ